MSANDRKLKCQFKWLGHACFRIQSHWVNTQVNSGPTPSFSFSSHWLWTQYLTCWLSFWHWEISISSHHSGLGSGFCYGEASYLIPVILSYKIMLMIYRCQILVICIFSYPAYSPSLISHSLLELEAIAFFTAIGICSLDCLSTVFSQSLLSTV